MGTRKDHHRLGTRTRRAAAGLIAVACVAALVGASGSPAGDRARVVRLRFDCATTPGFYDWEAPPGFDGPIKVVVAGAAGGDGPGIGRPGTGAVIQATLTIPSTVKRIIGEIGCSGETPRAQGLPGGTGGAAVGDADAGAAGGGGTYLRAGGAFLTTINAEIYAGGGGGIGGRGSGSGFNVGGDGGSAGEGGRPDAQPGERGDLGETGGGAGGRPPCGNQRRGHDGASASGAGGGGGGGGGGFRGGCGGGAGFALEQKVGSGGGGESGSSSISGTARSTGWGQNRGDGYVLISYDA